MPYWEAGDAYLPYSQGYFPAEGTAAAALTWGFAATYTAPGPGEADHSGVAATSVGGDCYGGDLGAGGDGGGGGE